MDLIEDYTTALVAGDEDRLASTLSEAIRLFPPTSFKVFEGRAAVTRVLRTVTAVLDDFRFVHRLGAANHRYGLVFEARINGTPLDGWDYVELDDAGLITAITVMMRPLPALEMFAEKMGRVPARHE